MMRGAKSYPKPENALHRAEEFISVNKHLRALEVLYEVIRRSKMRASFSEKLLEPIMCKYLDLCVILRMSHIAKEGLYQYRNIFQNVSISSIETVVKYYLKAAEEKTEEARQKSAKIDEVELDTSELSPEELLLVAVCGEDAQDRNDRTVLTPWVKFLWESYRQCLELLRSNSKVEKLYHSIAQNAFKFCVKYNRKTEFRKLCENLRIHLLHTQNQRANVANPIDINNPDTQEFHLQTRLVLLRYAMDLELWQEAYRAIEDLCDLLKRFRRTTKVNMITVYFDHVAVIFWHSGNYLYHAAALLKSFQMIGDNKRRATSVIVAALCIPPVQPQGVFDRFIETSKTHWEKSRDLAGLLQLRKTPTRESVISEILEMGLLDKVPSKIQEMFDILETEFEPLTMCDRMEKCTNWMVAKFPSLKQYVNRLHSVTVVTMVKQLAQVYSVISIDRLQKLTKLGDHLWLERILITMVKDNELQIRIDHRKRAIFFSAEQSDLQKQYSEDEPMLQSQPAQFLRNQLMNMKKSLNKCMQTIDAEKQKEELQAVRTRMIEMYEQTHQRDHLLILERQNIIEGRKEDMEDLQPIEEKMLDTQRRERRENKKRQKDIENDRMIRESSKRQRKQQEEEVKQMNTRRIKDKLVQISKTTYGQKVIENINQSELISLGPEDILQRQVEELEKERLEMQKVLRDQEKSVDHFERARRLMDVPILKENIAKQKQADKVFWQNQEIEREKKGVKEHKNALQQCQRLQRMTPERDAFMEKLLSERRSEIKKKMDDFNVRLEAERKKRLHERKEKRIAERREAYNRHKEEEKQKQREEAMKKQQQAEEERKVPAPAAERPPADRNGDADKSEPWRPKMGAWREIEKQKLDSWRPGQEKGGRETSERPTTRDVRQEDNEESDWRAAPPPPVERKKTEPFKEESRTDWRSGGDHKDRGMDRPRDRDNERGPPRAREERGAPRDLERAPPKDKELERGPPPRELERGPPRDTERAPPPRDLERATPRDRDLERGGPPRKRDNERGPPKDFDRGSQRDRDFEKGPSRDAEIERAPARDREITRAPPRDREITRAPPRDREAERGPPKDRDFGRGDRGAPRDFERGDRGAPRDFERGPQRDFDRGNPRDRNMERGPPRDFERSHHRDFDRGNPRDRDFERGSNRDIERGPQRDRGFERGQNRDEGFERGPPRDRDFDRVPSRDFERGPQKDRDFERGSGGGGRGGYDRESNRGPPRDFGRGPPRDRDTARAPPSWRDGGGDGSSRRERDEESTWRRNEAIADARKEAYKQMDRKEREEHGILSDVPIRKPIVNFPDDNN